MASRRSCSLRSKWPPRIGERAWAAPASGARKWTDKDGAHVMQAFQCGETEAATVSFTGIGADRNAARADMADQAAAACDAFGGPGSTPYFRGTTEEGDLSKTKFLMTGDFSCAPAPKPSKKG